jgi:uncharacterized protein (DUF1697 family)
MLARSLIWYAWGMKYVALLRGIGPGNPNMRNDKLRGVLEDLGFADVQTVISSGNVTFESSSKDIKAMQDKIEKAWPEKLGFNSTTIIRSQQQLEKLVQLDPFAGLEHGPKSYLLVTFFKYPAKIDYKLPYQPLGKPYKLTGIHDNALFTVTDNSQMPTTDLMGWLEKQFGKEITSRTWLTIRRILKKMDIDSKI